MTAYIIMDLAPLDPVQMKEYLDGANASVELYGGSLLAASGDLTSLEGDWSPERIAIVVFSSLEKAKGWYRSNEYQAVLPLRLKESSRDSMVIVPGVKRPARRFFFRDICLRGVLSRLSGLLCLGAYKLAAPSQFTGNIV